MKIKNILAILCATVLMTVFTRCSEDGGGDGYVFKQNMEMDKADVEIDPGQTANATIMAGNGSYTVRSTNETVATASMAGSDVSIQGVASGKASIIVTDREGVNAIVNVLVYNDLTISESVVNMKTLTQQTLQVTLGNGGYRLDYSEPQLDITVNEQGEIIINAKGDEVTDVPVTLLDRSGKSRTFTVSTTHHDLTLQTNAMNMETNKTQTVKITSGNGGYTLSTIPQNLSMRIGTDTIYVTSTAIEISDAAVTVTDRTGRTQTLTINVMDPYKLIAGDNTPRMEYKTYRKEIGDPVVNFTNSVASGYHTFGWREPAYRYRYIDVRIPTTQDLTVVGLKTGAQMRYDFDDYGAGDSYSTSFRNVNFLEVIKYEAPRVWIVFEYTKTGAGAGTFRGVICMDI